MTRFWERMIQHQTTQKAVELAGGLALMAIAGIFSPTYWLMTLVLKPYFDLKTVFSGPNILSGYLHLVLTMKALGPQVVLLQILPLLCLCLLTGIAYSAVCTWIGIQLTKRLFKNIPQAA